MADVSQSVGELSELYLGNILYALELAAISLDEQGKATDAAFYRGIARKLAEARGAKKIDLGGRVLQRNRQQRDTGGEREAVY